MNDCLVRGPRVTEDSETEFQEYAHKRAAVGQPFRCTWYAVAETARERGETVAAEDRAPLIGHFKSRDLGRENQDVTEARALVLDCDGAPSGTWARVLAGLRAAGLAALCYTTRRSTVESERLRIVLPLACAWQSDGTATRVDEWKAAYNVLRGAVEAALGVELDPACANIARIVFDPYRVNEAAPPRAVEWVDGDGLDFDATVARLRALERPEPAAGHEDPPPAPPRPAAPSGASDGDRNRGRWEGALRRAEDDLAGRPLGKRHDARLAWARWLGKRVGAGLGSFDEAEAALLRGVRRASEETPEARKTIRDGLKYGEARPEGWPEDDGPKDNGGQTHSGAGEDQGAATATDTGDWQAPLPLPVPEGPPPALPVEIVPEALRAWALQVSRQACLPLEMVVGPALVVLSSLVGARMTIQPDPLSSWVVVPNLWGLLAAPPSSIKSDTVDAATRPMKPLTDAAEEEYRRAKADADARRAILDAQIARLKKAPAADEAELADLMERTEACRAPRRRYVVGDATVEAIQEVARDNGQGFLVNRDELYGLIAAMDKPDRAGTRETFLEGWSGLNGLPVDRIGRGSFYIPRLCMALIGTIQPGKLAELVGDACGAGRAADGFHQRFQVAIVIERLPAWQAPTEAPDPALPEAMELLYASLDRLEPAEWGADTGPSGLPCLRFDDEGQALFAAWRDVLEHRLRGPDLAGEPAFASHLGKYRSLMPSLALLFHLMDTPRPDGVSLACARLAAAWCDYLETHARRMYRPEERARRAPAEELASRIEAGELRDGDTVRDLARKGWRDLSTSDRVETALADLSALGWVRIVETPSKGRGRPARVIKVNPALRGAS